MKIAFLNIYNGLVNRGAERTTHELAIRLAKNHEVWLLQGGQEAIGTSYNIKTISLLLPKYKDTSLSISRKFYLDVWSLQILIFTILSLPFLWRENFSIIIPINGGWQTLICRLLTWLKKTKMVIIGRAGIGRDDTWNLLCKPDAFVALTLQAFKWAGKYNRSVNIAYIPNGVDLNVFRPEGNRAKLTLKKPIIICVAALMPNKRIDLTIQAVVKLKQASLLILGDGLMKDSLRDLGGKLLGKERFFLLQVEKENIADYYRTADIFTLVSKPGEAFGNVYLEAMACNLPVVATDDDTRHEIVGKAGLFVDPNNIDDYAEVLNRALEIKFNNKSRKQAEKFSWDTIMQKYETLFAKLS